MKREYGHGYREVQTSIRSEEPTFSPVVRFDEKKGICWLSTATARFSSLGGTQAIAGLAGGLDFLPGRRSTVGSAKWGQLPSTVASDAIDDRFASALEQPTIGTPATRRPGLGAKVCAFALPGQPVSRDDLRPF
jgi:hypothetical protein